MSHAGSGGDHCGHRLMRCERIRTRGRFLEIQARGRRIHTPHFVLMVLRNDVLCARWGITVTRRAARTAVERNRIRRVVRECFRLHRDIAPLHYDVVVVARKSAGALGYHEAARELVLASRALPLDDRPGQRGRNHG